MKLLNWGKAAINILIILGSGTRSVVKWLTAGGGEMAAYALLFMTLVVTGDVFARFLLGAGTNWSIEVTGYLLAMLVFLGLAYTLRERAHIRITFLVDRLPRKVQGWSNVITSLIFLAYTIFLCYLTWRFTSQSIAFKATSRTGADIILWPFQIVMPVGLAIISLLLISNIYTQIKKIVVNRSGSLMKE